jgi:hypothetical protein
MVSIQLQESVAAALSAQANERGLSLEAFLAQVAALPVQAEQPIHFDDWERELDALSFEAQPLPADFSRADIYLEHD